MRYFEEGVDPNTGIRLESTTTADQVRSAYIYAQQIVNGHVDPGADFGVEFDQWLSAHDLEVARQALHSSAYRLAALYLIGDLPVLTLTAEQEDAYEEFANASDIPELLHDWADRISEEWTP